MYVQWILGVPQNKNFSFERDSNNDGIPDEWIGDIARCERYEDFNCPHGFGVDHGVITSEVFDSRGGLSKISFKYKFVRIGSTGIVLTSSGGQIFTDTINITATGSKEISGKTIAYECVNLFASKIAYKRANIS